MKRVSLLVCAAVTLVACKPPFPKYPYDKLPDPRNRELVLGVSDVIKINVWDNSNFNTEAVVRPDGTITMPLVGDLKAAGETPSSLRNHITERLTDFVHLVGPAVQVQVQGWHGYKFRVDGEVVKPGVYESQQYLSAADAIALAGGPTRFAKRSEIRVLRTDAKTHEVASIPLDYDLMTSGKRNDMNIWILSGDAINVP